MADVLEVPEGLVTRLRATERVAVLTGAGISAESGVPTFREAQTGLWAQYDPESLATPAAFLRDPNLVWNWYAWRRSLITRARPNKGHLALVRLEAHIPECTLITQNVDGLHQLAGSRTIIELHGNIHRNRCSQEGVVVEAAPGDDSGILPPVCPNCGALLRPDVVWFGEPLPRQALLAAYQAAERAQLFFSIGTSALVQPAAHLPLRALECGASLVEINPQETVLTPRSTWSLRGPAGDFLPALVAMAWPHDGRGK